MIRLTILIITPEGYIRNHFRYKLTTKEDALKIVRDWVTSGMNIYPEDASYVAKDLNTVFVHWIDGNDIFGRNKMIKKADESQY